MASSFDKVCKNLADTPDFRSYLLRIGEVLDQAIVCGWEFHTSGSSHDGTLGVALPGFKFLIDWGKNFEGLDAGDLIQKVWESNMENFLIETDEFCTKPALLKLVRDNIGTKKCPTYNCKEDKIKEKFVYFARARVSEHFLDKIDKTQTRLRAEMQKARASDAFNQDRVTYHERHIAEDIKKVLIKYQKVAKPHVLKMALDEFICHELMESIANVTGSDVDSFYDGNEIGPVGRAGVQSEVDYLLSHAY
jgi:hypothetical protein